MATLAQERKLLEEKFRQTINNQVIKTTGYLQNLTKTEINQVLKSIKHEQKVGRFKKFIEGLLIQYDGDWELVERIVREAFEKCTGGKHEKSKV